MNVFDLSIVSPGGKFFENKAESLIAPGILGSFGVLANHAPMIAAVKSGVIRVKDQTREHFFVIDSGVVEVAFDHSVLALVDHATACETYERALSELKK